MTAPRLHQAETVDLLNTIWADRAGQYDELADARLATQWLGTDLSESMAVPSLASGPELRACLAPGCVLYFVKDHPRRAWCSTACGNRSRASRHYARHRR